MRKEANLETNGQQLNEKQLRAIPYLLSGKDVENACRAANISTTTFYNWLRNPIFKKELDKQRTNLITDAMTKLRSGVGAAVDRLLALVHSESEEIARKSATSVIEMVLKLRESEEVEQRLESIEKIILERRSYR
jgi:hypothetical protein